MRLKTTLTTDDPPGSGQARSRGMHNDDTVLFQINPRTAMTFLMVVVLGILLMVMDQQSIEMTKLSASVRDSWAATASTMALYYSPDTTTSSSSSSSSSSSNRKSGSRPKIALISGFVTRKSPAPRIKTDNFDHMINKACYADLWGYDFIFNTSWGFDEDIGNRYWLEYGTWHRVPHMAAALPDYDWIVYADVDWYVRDFTIPLESFIKDWELHGLHNVSVFVPVDWGGVFTFSAYVVMVRNNEFGHRMLHNWLRFADGICEDGNFNTTPGKYMWGDSDQPGIWYSLAKTHSEFFGHEFNATCDGGKIKSGGNFMGYELNTYFRSHQLVLGNQGKDLYNIPKDQPIIWSKIDNMTKDGLGIQRTFGKYAKAESPHAFAFHKKQQLVGQFKADVETCKRERGCYGYYDDAGVFQLGCNSTQ